VKHIQAGLIVGAIWFVVVAAAVSLTAILSIMLGTAIAASVVAVTIIIIVGASFIDWYTERKRSP